MLLQLKKTIEIKMGRKYLISIKKTRKKKIDIETYIYDSCPPFYPPHHPQEKLKVNHSISDQKSIKQHQLNGQSSTSPLSIAVAYALLLKPINRFLHHFLSNTPITYPIHQSPATSLYNLFNNSRFT